MDSQSSSTTPDPVPIAEPTTPVPDNRLHILVDTREQKGWTFDPAQVRVTRIALKEGDYTVEGLAGRVALERKSLGDFVKTVIHDWIRFRKELVRLSGYDIAAVCVEANIGQIYRHEYESEALPASVMGRVHSITLDHGIPVLFWENKILASDMGHKLLLNAWRKMYVAGVPEGTG